VPKASGRVRYIFCFVIPAEQIETSKSRKNEIILFSQQVQEGDQVIEIYFKNV
jgi:hypothetical protein